MAGPSLAIEVAAASVQSAAMFGILRSGETAKLVFLFVLGLGLGNRLPLHVLYGIRAASAQRLNVVDDVTRACAPVEPVCWAWILALELGADCW